MKKIIYLLMVLMPMAFASCDSDPYYNDWGDNWGDYWGNGNNNSNGNSGNIDEENENTTVEKELIGTFEYQNSSTEYAVIKLLSDLSGSYTQYEDGVITEEYYFSWKVYDDEFYFTKVNSSKTTKMPITIMSSTQVKFGSYLYTRMNSTGNITTLNTYEQLLLGTWKNTDTQNGTNVLVLNKDLTGSWTSTDGTTNAFTWIADASNLTVLWTNGGTTYKMAYTLVNGLLTVDNIPMAKVVSNTVSFNLTQRTTARAITNFSDCISASTTAKAVTRAAKRISANTSFSMMR